MTRCAVAALLTFAALLTVHLHGARGAAVVALLACLAWWGSSVDARTEHRHEEDPHR